MMTLEKSYAQYRRQLRKFNEQIDSWYTIASQKYSEGDRDGQKKAYDEINAIQAKIDALMDPLESELLEGDGISLED